MPNLTFALRTFAKTPFITAVAVLSLALGIGANAAIYSIFDQVLLQPLPVEDPGSLVNLGAPGPKPGSVSCNDSGECDQTFSYPMFRDLERAGGPFTGVAAHRGFGANLATGERTLNGEGTLVSGSYFSVLDLQPELGRLLGPDDDVTPGAHPVAVLSHRFWTADLGADPGVLNRTIVVNGATLTIVGVAPRGFDGTTLGTRPHVFVPLSMRAVVEPASGAEQFEQRTQYWAYLFARLKPGVALDQASSEINSVYRAIINDVEAPLQEEMSASTLERFRARQLTLDPGQKGQSQMQEGATAPLLLLFSITGLVLVIACANIANLLLATGAGRSQEMAVRASLGASRGQLLAQLVSESLLLAAAGGVLSILVARWTLDSIMAIMPPEVSSALPLVMSPAAIGFTAVLSLGTGLLFGLYPALHSTGTDLQSILRASSGQPSGARAAARFRSTLVTAQIALSMALLVAAGLFIKSLVNISRVDLGIRQDNLVAFGISPMLNGYDTQRSHALFQQVEDELAAIPGVTDVTSSMVAVFSGSEWGTDVGVQGFVREPDTDANSRFNEVGPGYFGALGVPLLAGREFTRADAAEGPRVAIVNEAFVEKFGLGREAVGKRMGRGSDELDIEIVGVVQNAKYSEVKDAVPPLFYTPYRQNTELGFLTFYVRTASDPSSVMRAIPALISRLDPNLPVEELKTLEQQVRESLFIDRMISRLSGAFALLATLLAAIGLYGVLAYTVAQRTREIGLRMALGAGADQVRGMVLKQVSRMIAVGIALGLVAAFALGRLARSLLFELEAHDPVVLVSVTALLGLIALAAAMVPALRASRVDPMQALRYQ